MSKVKIEGNASGTGTFTIASPNSNTDRTLTLPDVAGTLLTADGDGSALTGISSYSDSDALDLFNVTGSAPVYAVRAWCLYNGVANTITASGNISSVTDVGTGRFTFNFTTAMPDTNYIHIDGSSQDSGETGNRSVSYEAAQTKTTSAIELWHINGTTKYDTDNVSVAFLR